MECDGFLLRSLLLPAVRWDLFDIIVRSSFVPLPPLRYKKRYGNNISLHITSMATSVFFEESLEVRKSQGSLLLTSSDTGDTLPVPGLHLTLICKAHPHPCTVHVSLNAYLCVFSEWFVP